MKFGPVFFLLGRLLVVIAVTLLVPAGVAYFHDGPDFQAFLISAGLALVAGLTLQRVFKSEEELVLGRREAFVLVAGVPQ